MAGDEERRFDVPTQYLVVHRRVHTPRLVDGAEFVVHNRLPGGEVQPGGIRGGDRRITSQPSPGFPQTFPRHCARRIGDPTRRDVRSGRGAGLPGPDRPWSDDGPVRNQEPLERFSCSLQRIPQDRGLSGPGCEAVGGVRGTGWCRADRPPRRHGGSEITESFFKNLRVTSILSDSVAAEFWRSRTRLELLETLAEALELGPCARPFGDRFCPVGGHRAFERVHDQIELADHPVEDRLAGHLSGGAGQAGRRRSSWQPSTAR